MNYCQFQVNNTNTTDKITLALLHILANMWKRERERGEKSSRNTFERHHELWKELAQAVDRICFVGFGIVMLLGTIIVLVAVPEIHDVMLADE